VPLLGFGINSKGAAPAIFRSIESEIAVITAAFVRYVFENIRVG
jgi:hypothetical protein